MGGGGYNIFVMMMSNNFSPRKNLKTVWRNIAVAVFAVCFAILGLCVTLIPSRATDDGVKRLGTIALGYFPQTYVGNELNETLKALLDTALTGKVWTADINGTVVKLPEYVYGDGLYVRVPSALLYRESQTVSTGEQLVTGKSYFFKVEPIVWDLFQYHGTVVALMRHLLVTMAYNHSSLEPTTAWTGSTFRSYLNNEFINESKLGEYALPRTYHESSGDNNDAGAELTDQVWCPSYLEIVALRPTVAERVVSTTDFMVATYGGSAAYPVLRTGDGTSVYKIKTNGEIYDFGGKEAPADGPLIAFVLDETKLPVDITDIDTVYNGNDRRVEKMINQPDWYSSAMTITYKKDGVLVDEVKDAGEYHATVTLGSFTREFTLTVAPREVTLSGAITADDKTYDRGREATLNTVGVQVNGRVDGDDLNFAYRGVFVDKNAGADKLVTVTTTMTGNDAKNYTLIDPQFTATATIKPQTVVASGVTVNPKEYDGTTRANLNTQDISFTGKLKGDDLTVVADGKYQQVDVGNDLPIDLVYTLVGDDAGNYKLEKDQDQITGNITQRLITVTINHQTVKVGDPLKALTARVTSGSLVDPADEVYELSIKTDPDVDVDHLPVGEYEITGKGINDNYDIDFVDGKYTVLTPEAWEALQTTEEKDGNNAWLIIVIVIAIAAFVGALVGVGLVIRSHDKNREPKPTKEKKVKKTGKGAKQPEKAEQATDVN